MNNKNRDARIIKTARSKETINEAARVGLWPLVKPVQPSKEIWRKVLVTQNKISGEIDTAEDFRLTSCELVDNCEAVTEFIYYYPHEVGNPYAAYLIPPDLKPGDYVYLEDLIEDIKNEIWSQGDSVRLNSCHAIWNGESFELDENEVKQAAFSDMIG